MNEVVPDWLHREDTTKASGTAIPNKTIFHCEDLEKAALRDSLMQMQEENRKLRAENAELRKKAMTNMDRIQSADKESLIGMIAAIYSWGILDVYSPLDGSPLSGDDTAAQVEDWLDKREWEV